MANLSWFSLALLLFFHMSRAIHTNNNKNKHNGLSSRLINLESLDSSLYRSNLTVEGKTERLVRSFEFRLGRVKSPKSLSHGNYSLSQLKRQHSNITRLSIYQFYQGIYLVQVGIGKFRGSRPPFKSYYLVLDTGSGPIWTQCQGCNSCFSQRDPVFPMDRSLTYRASPCNQCPSSTSCVQNHCTLNYTYVDGTQIHGISASEKFMFVPNNAVFFATTWSLRFLCVVRSEKVAFAHWSNIASGIFGMNRDPSSFMGQRGARLGDRFSYCFTPMLSHYQQPQMFLRFGADIPRVNLMYRTPLIQGPDSHYYLDLQAITVGHAELRINPSVFQLREDGLGGTYINSGSRDTWLIDVAYREFGRELRHTMALRYPKMKAFRQGGLLCFTQSKGVRTVFPVVKFHFANGADFVIKQEAYVKDFGSVGLCSLIVPSDKSTVLGARQQVDHRIIYDIANSELQFERTDCSRHN